MSNLILYSIPLFLLLVILEVLYTARRPHLKGYAPHDTAASLSMGVINVAISAGTKFLSIPLFAFVYEHRLLDVMSLGAVAWVILLFTEDLCYYWFHRLHHEVRVLWAAHVNHHSSEHYNLSTALRQPLLTPLTGPIFWVPLALIGFPPVMILTAQAWSLLYQFFLHTEAVDKLGPLEWILNTPSHHRVHHGSNVTYLDRNHGGIFILWDRLFGTFVREDEKVTYGLTTNVQTYHPLKIGFHELGAIARDMRRAPSLRARLGYVFQPPGWSHDGSTRTARELQRGARCAP